MPLGFSTARLPFTPCLPHLRPILACLRCLPRRAGGSSALLLPALLVLTYSVTTSTPTTLAFFLFHAWLYPTTPHMSLTNILIFNPVCVIVYFVCLLLIFVCMFVPVLLLYCLLTVYLFTPRHLPPNTTHSILDYSRCCCDSPYPTPLFLPMPVRDILADVVPVTPPLHNTCDILTLFSGSVATLPFLLMPTSLFHSGSFLTPACPLPLGGATVHSFFCTPPFLVHSQWFSRRGRHCCCACTRSPHRLLPLRVPGGVRTAAGTRAPRPTFCLSRAHSMMLGCAHYAHWDALWFARFTLPHTAPRTTW